MEDYDHHHCVNAWIERVATDQSRLLESFEAAFSALWQRAHLTLGEVTLSAIVKRVLCGAQEKFPFLSTLELDANGVQCDELRASAEQLPPDQVRDALAFVLVELMTVIGNLTADILTPALHEELSRAFFVTASGPSRKRESS